MRLILASGSPRRRELLGGIGIGFDVVVSDVEERQEPDEAVDAYVRRLARDKGAAVAASHPDAWVLSADTVVFIDGHVLEKPSSRADARAMLAKIAGREHVVYTGVALQHLQSGFLEDTVTASTVRMIDLSPDEIAWYVDTGEPMDKAGSYAVQGIGAMFIDSIDGSYSNVVGLPLSVVYDMLKRAGVWRRE
ncbi:MAG: septum formation inhibitor Maf [Acidobacteria bacterium]|nr:septum formation inhibitor Maf [Acidobacteriota bacterium]